MRLPISIRLPPGSSASAHTSGFVVDPLSKQPLLVELQGSLEVGADCSAGAIADAIIGELDLSQDNQPQLLIAHHLLTGKVVKLDKPLAVLRHTFPSTTQTAGGAEGRTSDSPPATVNKTQSFASSPDALRNASRLLVPKTPLATALSASSSSPLPLSPATPAGVVELREGSHEIIGILRTKLVFSKRPQPYLEPANSKADL